MVTDPAATRRELVQGPVRVASGLASNPRVFGNAASHQALCRHVSTGTFPHRGAITRASHCLAPAWARWHRSDTNVSQSPTLGRNNAFVCMHLITFFRPCGHVFLFFRQGVSRALFCTQATASRPTRPHEWQSVHLCFMLMPAVRWSGVWITGQQTTYSCSRRQPSSR